MTQVTVSEYYGVRKSYPKILREVYSKDPISHIYIDVIFDELTTNKAFVKEAREARKGVIKNPNKYPKLTID